MDRPAVHGYTWVYPTYHTPFIYPELEFFVFDSVKLLPSYSTVRDAWAGTGYEIESKEAPWSHTSGINHPIRFKEGYYPAPLQDTLTRMADNVLTYKNVVKNVAYNMKMVATFMTKPILNVRRPVWVKMAFTKS